MLEIWQVIVSTQHIQERNLCRDYFSIALSLHSSHVAKKHYILVMKWISFWYAYYLLLTRGNPNHWRQLLECNFFPSPWLKHSIFSFTVAQSIRHGSHMLTPHTICIVAATFTYNKHSCGKVRIHSPAWSKQCMVYRPVVGIHIWFQTHMILAWSCLIWLGNWQPCRWCFKTQNQTWDAKAIRSQDEDSLYKHTSPWRLTMRHPKIVLYHCISKILPLW